MYTRSVKTNGATCVGFNRAGYNLVVRKMLHFVLII